MMEGILLNRLARKVVELSGVTRVVYIESFTGADMVATDFNRQVVVKRARSVWSGSALEAPKPLLGILHASVHWVAYAVELEQQSNTSFVNVIVMDSGLQQSTGISGSVAYTWNGCSNWTGVPPDAHYSELTGEPSYVQQLLMVACWYCHCTECDRGTVIDINIQGTGQQLIPGSAEYSDGWSCGRWALANLCTLARGLGGWSCQRVSLSLEQVHGMALELAELVCCFD